MENTPKNDPIKKLIVYVEGRIREGARIQDEKSAHELAVDIVRATVPEAAQFVAIEAAQLAGQEATQYGT
jgi:phage baseplate assembly protein gpV